MKNYTSCPKIGIKIHESKNNNSNNNSYLQDPFMKPSRLSKSVSFQNTTLNSLDLDLENYSLSDLYHLFNINDGNLDESSMRNAKQIVLKMHPDKSRLDSKYFLFFSNAYKRLFSVYEFQNKSSNKKEQKEYSNDNKTDNALILDNLFEKNKNFKDPKNFNSWFNETFEKHRLEDPIQQGYGDWLKSNDDFIDVNENVTKGNMNDIFEQKKKQIQTITRYNGISDSYSSTFGGSLLDGSDAGQGYTDLKEAYTQTLIPVTMEDYNKMQKFNNISEYKAHRERVDITPLSKEEANRKLLYDNEKREQESAALAFKYAKESEKVKEKQNSFWGELKQLTGF
jgi:hypothetical protein